MVQIPGRQLAVYAIAALAVVFVGSRFLRSDIQSDGEKREPVAVKVSRGEGFARVHVSGAVRRPGVYRIKGSARVDDAIKRAGGPTRKADTGSINLAAKLQDGQHVILPSRDERPGPGVAVDREDTSESAQISLSTATQQELETLDGVGPVTARKILDFRTENGGFSSVEDLKRISGIGEKRFEALKDRVSP